MRTLLNDLRPGLLKLRGNVDSDRAREPRPSSSGRRGERRPRPPSAGGSSRQPKVRRGCRCGEFTPISLEEPLAYCYQVAAAGPETPEAGGEVVDRSAPATGEAAPAALSRGICVEAGELVLVERAGDLVVAPRRLSEQVGDVDDGRNRRQRRTRTGGRARGLLPAHHVAYQTQKPCCGAEQLAV
jgi:hypothetical protein